MSNIFGGGIFGNQNQNAMDQLRQQIELQQSQYNKMQQAAQQQSGTEGLMEAFKSVVATLSQDEQSTLMKSSEFVQAKTIYEQAFIDFLASKFAGEYLSTPIGKQAIENLTECAKKSVNAIKEATKERNLKLEALAKLAESDPEIQKKLQKQLSGE